MDQILKHVRELSNFYGLSQKQEEMILLYFHELLDYTRKVNLIAWVEDKEVLWDRHIEDVFLGLNFFNSYKDKKKIADIGSGGGLPGILLGICLPHHEFYLVESKKKKVNFLKMVVTKLQLNNVFIYEKNALEVREKMDIITARAFGSIKKIVDITKYMQGSEITFLLYKGKRALLEEEIEEFESSLGNSKKVDFHVYSLHGVDRSMDRHLVKIEMKDS